MEDMQLINIICIQTTIYLSWYMNTNDLEVEWVDL